MIALLLYTLLISILVAIAARAIESLGVSLGYARRWVWIGAAMLILGLVVSAPIRVAPPTQLPVVAQDRVALPAAVVQEDSWLKELFSRIEAARQQVVTPVESLVSRADRALSPRAATYVAGAWVAASVFLFVTLLTVQLRFVRVRRRWPIADVQGVTVRVAPNVGPVVIGLARPEIVVPQWLLARTHEEQQLVVAHEAEHVRARDTLLLAGGCLIVALMPWNPITWYLLSRLRLAVELDCDARVLRAGAAPLSYGSLLIDVAERNAGLRLGLPALADDSSHLHQRILAMNMKRPKFLLARTSVASMLGLAAILMACEAKVPTSAEIDQMDAASAEQAATKLAMLKSTGVTEYIVDGHKATAQEASAIPADAIAKVEVTKTAAGGTIAIQTKAAGASDQLATIEVDQKAAKEGDAVRIAHGAGVKISGSVSAAGSPVIFVDGVKQSSAVLKSLNPDDIKSIDVLKGAAALKIGVDDPNAANGVIYIKTKKGSL